MDGGGAVEIEEFLWLGALPERPVMTSNSRCSHTFASKRLFWIVSGPDGKFGCSKMPDLR